MFNISSIKKAQASDAGSLFYWQYLIAYKSVLNKSTI